MIKTVEAQEVADHFSDWLKQVAAGHEVVITERLKPLAKLVPPDAGADEASMSSAAQRGEAFEAWMKTDALSGRWVGEAVIDRAVIAEEMFDRK